MKTLKIFLTVLLITLSLSEKSFSQIDTIKCVNNLGSSSYIRLGQTFTPVNSGGILSIAVSPVVSMNGVTLKIFDDLCGSVIYQEVINLHAQVWDEHQLSQVVYVKKNRTYQFLMESPHPENREYDVQLSLGNTYSGGGEITGSCDTPENWTDLLFVIRIDQNQPPSEISITQGSANITDGSTYNFGGITTGTNRDKQFTISNSGSGNLKITSPISFNAGADPEFSIISQPEDVEPGETSTFTIRFSPTSSDVKSASLSIDNNDSNENPYDIIFTGSGGYPDINLKQSATDIADGGSYNYGNTDTHTNNDVIFTIENPGTALLILTTPLTISGANSNQFSITHQPNAEISAGGSSTFTCRFTPTSIGSKTAEIDISSNDSDENPYNLTLNGTGVDVEMNLKQSSTDIADGGSFNFSNTDISGTTDETFTIQNTGNASRALTIITPLSIAGTNSDQFSIVSQPSSSVAAGQNTTFTVRFSPSSEGSKSASIAITNNDADENPYNLTLTGTAIGYPQMEVLGNDILINNGDNTPGSSDGTDFGTAALSGATSVHTFTIENTGNGTLHLDGSPLVSISGEGASEFSVTVLPSPSVGPYNSTTTYQITFDPSTNGVRNAVISIANDDADNNPYTFSITGIGDNQTAPYATSFLPGSNESFYIRQNMVIQFNEDVFAVAGKNINIYDSFNNLFEQIPTDDTRVTVSGNQVAINPNGSFTAGMEYYVLIDEGAFKDIVDDTYGGISGSTEWRFTPSEAEPPGRCFYFDGTDDYATIPLTMPNNGTVEFWFKIDNISTSQTFWNCNSTYWYVAYIANDALWCKISNGVLKYSPIYANTWYHAAVTWQKDLFGLTYSLYINGSFVTSTSNETWINPNSTVYIGMMESALNHLNGKIEEFRIWSDVRTITEIQDNMFKTLTRTEPNLLAYYRLDEMNGNTLFDETANLNNGTLSNVSDNSWVTSTAPVGTYGKSVRTTVATTSGEDGKNISTTITSTPSSSNNLGIYSTGNGDGKITTDDFGSSGATQRSNILWGVQEYGNCNADLVFNYSGIAGATVNESSLKLMKRSDASSAWTDVTSSAAQSTGSHTFTMTGQTSFSEFSIGDGGSNPLPVELSAFTANVNENKVILKWQTATEVNNYGFEIERSIQNSKFKIQNWEKIGFVAGHGNSNSLKDYTFTDNETVAERSRSYRLKQIDTDGSFEYSAVVEVSLSEETPAKFELSQNYPNPFNPSTEISYQLPAVSQVTLKVYDILGREVATLVNKQQNAGNYSVNFNASNLTSGIYFYRMESGKFVQTKKLLLMK